MSAHALANVMRREAARVTSLGATPRFGLVDSYNPNDHTAKVLLSPSNAITGWLPVGISWMGNGWGFIAPLQSGDQVLVVFSQGDQDSGVIVCRLYDQQHNVPTTPEGELAAAGELLLVHQTGASIHLSANGHVRLHSTSEVEVGNVLSTLLPLLTSVAADLLNGHTHQILNVASGSATKTTQPMTQQLGAPHETAVLKAN